MGDGNGLSGKRVEELRRLWLERAGDRGLALALVDVLKKRRTDAANRLRGEVFASLQGTDGKSGGVAAPSTFAARRANPSVPREARPADDPSFVLAALKAVPGLPVGSDDVTPVGGRGRAILDHLRMRGRIGNCRSIAEGELDKLMPVFEDRLELVEAAFRHPYVALAASDDRRLGSIAARARAEVEASDAAVAVLDACGWITGAAGIGGVATTRDVEGLVQGRVAYGIVASDRRSRDLPDDPAAFAAVRALRVSLGDDPPGVETVGDEDLRRSSAALRTPALSRLFGKARKAFADAVRLAAGLGFDGQPLAAAAGLDGIADARERRRAFHADASHAASVGAGWAGPATDWTDIADRLLRRERARSVAGAVPGGREVLDLLTGRGDAEVPSIPDLPGSEAFRTGLDLIDDLPDASLAEARRMILERRGDAASFLDLAERMAPAAASDMTAWTAAIGVLDQARKSTADLAAVELLDFTALTDPEADALERRCRWNVHVGNSGLPADVTSVLQAPGGSSRLEGLIEKFERLAKEDEELFAVPLDPEDGPDRSIPAGTFTGRTALPSAADTVQPEVSPPPVEDRATGRSNGDAVQAVDLDDAASLCAVPPRTLDRAIVEALGALGRTFAEEGGLAHPPSIFRPEVVALLAKGRVTLPTQWNAPLFDGVRRLVDETERRTYLGSICGAVSIEIGKWGTVPEEMMDGIAGDGAPGVLSFPGSKGEAASA